MIDPMTHAYETVPFDVTIRVSDAALRKEYQAMMGHVRDMIIKEVAEQVGVPFDEVNYDRLTVTRTPMRALKEEHYRTKGVWFRQLTLAVHSASEQMTPNEALRSCVEGAAKFIPGATEGQVREVANRVVKWLGQAGYEVVRRAD